MMTKDRLRDSLLKILFRSGSVIDSFTVFRRLKVSYPAFSAALENAKSAEYVVEEGKRLRLTRKGKNYVLTERCDLVGGEKLWRKPPEDMLQSRLTVGNLYVPSIRRLDDRTFKVSDIKLD